MAEIVLDVSTFSKIPNTVKSEKYQTLYINASRMGISPWDVRMTLGHVLEREPGIAINEDQTTIVMTPSMAKALLENLAMTLRAYEQAFGEIGNPTAAIEKAQAAQKAAKLADTPPEKPAKSKKS